MKKNMNLYIFIAVMLIFTIGFFTAAFRSSFAFPTGKENTQYEQKILLIKKGAEVYAEEHPDIFTDKDAAYITVDELVKLGYLIADNENGDVKDPSSEIKTLNDLRIRIKNDNGQITSKILS